jgi:transcriptional regulator with GAF, ATPase, and Fis domain
VARQRGYFEIANGGTIFFDEIGTISLDVQAKLLRVMQEKEFMPLGSGETVKVDVRILAATNSDLRKLVEEGRFREDLFYRINVINLSLPPLRDRKEDIPALVEYFFTKYCQENEKFLDSNRRSLLRFERTPCRFSWSTTGRATSGNWRTWWSAPWCSPPTRSSRWACCRTSCCRPAACASAAIRVATCRPRHPCSRWWRIFERRKIIEVLESANWSQTDAAESLRIPLSTLNQKIKRLNIETARRVRRRPSAGRKPRGKPLRVSQVSSDSRDPLGA